MWWTGFLDLLKGSSFGPTVVATALAAWAGWWLRGHRFEERMKSKDAELATLGRQLDLLRATPDDAKAVISLSANRFSEEVSAERRERAKAQAELMSQKAQSDSARALDSKLRKLLLAAYSDRRQEGSYYASLSLAWRAQWLAGSLVSAIEESNMRGPGILFPEPRAEAERNLRSSLADLANRLEGLSDGPGQADATSELPKLTSELTDLSASALEELRARSAWIEAAIAEDLQARAFPADRA